MIIIKKESLQEIDNILSLMHRMENKNIVNEGIDINYNDFTISYNPYHQNTVDISIENNPTVSLDYGKNIRVYSLLKRKKVINWMVIHFFMH